MLAENCATAAKNAIADMSPAELSYGRVTLEGMNFVRHYRQEDGNIVGSNFGTWDASPLKEHADVGDPGMQFVKISRAAEDKKDILLMNFQTHYGLYVEAYSADFDKKKKGSKYTNKKGSTATPFESSFDTDDFFEAALRRSFYAAEKLTGITE